jgi:3-oxoacyl-[acyl-carrier protein] reductase
MGDRYLNLAASRPGRGLLRRLGLPGPLRLRRYAAGEPLVPGPVLLGGDGRLGASLGKVLASIGVEPRDAGTGDDPPSPNAALVFDATGRPSRAGCAGCTTSSTRTCAR